MISQLWVGILAIFVSFMMVANKRRRIWPILMLVLVSALFFLYFNDIDIGLIKEKSYLWLSYPHLQSRFNLLYSPEMLKSLNCILISVWMLLWLNAFNFVDDHPLSAANVQLLLLSSFIFMFSAQDFMQLMAGSCCFSILGFYQINDNKAKTRFIFYSFVAEMAIFTSLAIVYAKMNGISLSSLSGYAKKGWHKDLVSILILIGIFAKCGMFLFQNQLLSLQNLSVNRLLGGALLASPLSGLVLYYKLTPLIKVSSCSSSVITIIVCLTFLTSLFGLWWHNNLKNKMLYFCMLFFAFALYNLHTDKLNIHQIISLIPFIFVINYCLFLSFYGHMQRCNVLLALISVLVFIDQLLILPTDNFVYLGFIVSGLSVVLHQIFFNGKCFSCLPLVSDLAGYILFVLIGNVFILLSGYYFSQQFISWALIFILMFLFIPQKFCNLLSSKEWFQENDWLSVIYGALIVSPLRLLGRLLWILVDFMLIERGLMGKISDYSSGGILFLRKLQDTSIYNWIWLWLIGLLLMLINIGKYAYE